MYQMRDTVYYGDGAPDDGRIVRPKDVEQNKENKDYLNEVVHLVGSSTNMPCQLVKHTCQIPAIYTRNFF